MSDPGETDGGDPTAGISETKGEPIDMTLADSMGGVSESDPFPNNRIQKIFEDDADSILQLILDSQEEYDSEGDLIRFRILKKDGGFLKRSGSRYISVIRKCLSFMRLHPDVIQKDAYDSTIIMLEGHLDEITRLQSAEMRDVRAGGPIGGDDPTEIVVDADIKQLMDSINESIKEPGEDALEQIADVLDSRVAELSEQVAKIADSSVFKINPEGLVKALFAEAKKALQVKPPSNPITDLAFDSANSKLGRETSRTLQELSKCKYPFKRVIHASALEKALTNHDYCRFRDWMSKNHPEFQRIHNEEDVLPEEFANMSASAIRSLMNAYIKIFGGHIGVNRRKCTAKSSLKDCAFEYGEIRELSFMFLSNIPPPSAVIELPKAVEKKIEPIAVKSSDTKVQPVKSPISTTPDIMQRLRMLMGESAILGHASNSSFARTGLEARVVGQPSTQTNAPARNSKQFGKPVRKIAF